MKLIAAAILVLASACASPVAPQSPHVAPAAHTSVDSTNRAGYLISSG